MPKQVTAAVAESVGHIAIREFPLPEIGQDDGLLKVEMVGVCGSDPGLLSGKLQGVPFPVIMGHEILGRIAGLGKVAAERWRVKEGDRVVVESQARCGFCPACITGDYTFCERALRYGTLVSTSVYPYLWGGYAEYMYLAPGTALHKISESVPAEAGVLVTAALANGIRWGQIGRFCVGDAVVIQGCGQQGLALVVAAKEAGVDPIIVTGRSASSGERFALAKLFGAHYTINVDRGDPVEQVRKITGGRMADVVVDVAGSSQALQSSMQLVRSQGTLVSATAAGTSVTTPFPQDSLLVREVSVRFVRSGDFNAMRRAVKLVESGRYPIERIVSHRFPLAEVETAVRAAGRLIPDLNPTKVVVVP